MSHPDPHSAHVAAHPLLERGTLLKKAAGIEKGAQTTGKGGAVGQVTMAQIREIAETKMQDLNANDLDAACRKWSSARRARWGLRSWRRADTQIFVMAGLDPAIYLRVKPADDGSRGCTAWKASKIEEHDDGQNRQAADQGV